MTKDEAIQQFWSSFGLTAYDANTVPTGEDAPSLPYITYEVQTDSIGAILTLTGSLWYRSPSWRAISAKAEEIAEFIGYGYHKIAVDGGYLWITKGQPFAQRMSDPEDDMIRRIFIMLNAEFLTAY